MADNPAAKLNSDCHSAKVDRSALERVLRGHGEDFFRHITEHCPHLFADVPVFISIAQLQKMREVIAAVERVVGLDRWLQGTLDEITSAANNTPATPVIPAQAGIQAMQEFPCNAGTKSKAYWINPLDSGLRRNDGSNEVQHSAKGVFFGYDFHLNAGGAHLIEINTNAGGGFLNALLFGSQRDSGLPGKAVAVENLDQVFLDMFRNEWRLERGDAPLRTIAIVDERPEEQYLFPEFLLAKKLFERDGIATHIVDPAALQAREKELYSDDEKIDLVYNRLTDFSLQQHAALQQAYLQGQVVLTPHPHAYAKYADKRNLARLTDAQGLRALGADEADIATLQAGIPHAIVVRPDMEGTLWAERKQWFFKPNSGYGSKGAYRGANITRRVFGEIMHGVYVAQKMAAPGERVVCVNGAEPQPLKFDVRCYVYDGQVQLVAARLYQGQTTNFRTPGGGFAVVRVVE